MGGYGMILNSINDADMLLAYRLSVQTHSREGVPYLSFALQHFFDRGSGAIIMASGNPTMNRMNPRRNLILHL